jgi:NAD(P) transhydrogenase subunit alpha
MTIGVLKEPAFENRVSLLPGIISMLTKKGIELLVENEAGTKAFASDSDYLQAGARLDSAPEIIQQADILLSINHPSGIESVKQDLILIGVYQPLYYPSLMHQWAGLNLTVFSLDMLPRTTRAQNMDILSSQASIAGYKAVLLAAGIYPRYFPMLMTAAGSIPPAKVLVLGAGVAGLQAIATAKRLGAVVEVFDTRPAVKEEVMSLGAKFIEVDGAADASGAGGYAVVQTEDYKAMQQGKIAESIAKADIVITTAQIPGKKAPVLITIPMMEKMKNGSLIIDLAAATGGNTELTRDQETVWFKGTRIVGNSSLPSTVPSDASKLYGKNLFNFLQLIITKEGKLNLNWEDELVKGACVASKGQTLNERIRSIGT